jgi:hypothetical protein
MSDYKNYFLTSMGISKRSLEETAINKTKLEMGIEREKDEHGFSEPMARRVAKQHLAEPKHGHHYSGERKAEKAGMFKEKKAANEGIQNTAINSPILSPTAIATPVIGVAVRGSVSGGLPSGGDRMGDLSPSRLGGYEKIAINPVNSKLVDKTPANPEISQQTPINDNPSLQGGVTHPYQVQKDAGEPPQSVTGASTDGDNALTLKSSRPRGVDIDISEQAKDGAKKPFVTKWKMDSEKAGMVKTDENKEGLVRLSEAFERLGVLAGLSPIKEMSGVSSNGNDDQSYASPFARMRGLANLGERRVMSNGMWESSNKPLNESDNSTDSTLNAHPKLDKRVTTNERLIHIKQGLDKKSKRGTLTDKEAKLHQHITEALNSRGL